MPVRVISYAAGTISWTQNKIAELDRKSRESFNIQGSLHPRADINSLYARQNKGGNGLRQVEYTSVRRNCNFEYINNKRLNKPLLNAV